MVRCLIPIMTIGLAAVQKNENNGMNQVLRIRLIRKSTITREPLGNPEEHPEKISERKF